VRILVDGLDLSGKTTLVSTLIDTLSHYGVAAVRHRGMLAEHHPLERTLKRLPLAYQSRSSLITGAYLVGGYALDAVLVHVDPPRTGGAVLVQEGYADRTMAVGLAGGPYLPAVLAMWASRWFATFDVAVFLHASPAVRSARLDARERMDSGDRRSVVDGAFADRFDAVLLTYLGRRHPCLLVFDTGLCTPQEMAEEILCAAGLIRPPAPPAVRQNVERPASEPQGA